MASVQFDGDEVSVVSGVECGVGDGGVGAAGAEDLAAGEFLIAFGGGFGDEEFAGFEEGDEFVIGDEEKAVGHGTGGPEEFAFGGIYAANLGTGFLASVNAVEVTFVEDGSGEVAIKEVLLLPELLEFAVRGNFPECGADSVAGGGEEFVVSTMYGTGGIDRGMHGGAVVGVKEEVGCFVGEGCADQAFTGEEDGGGLVVQIGQDGGGVAGFVVGCLPYEFARCGVKGCDSGSFCILSATKVEENEVVVNYGGRTAAEKAFS